jgi:hypothetical protein
VRIGTITTRKLISLTIANIHSVVVLLLVRRLVVISLAASVVAISNLACLPIDSMHGNRIAVRA